MSNVLTEEERTRLLGYVRADLLHEKHVAMRAQHRIDLVHIGDRSERSRKSYEASLKSATEAVQKLQVLEQKLQRMPAVKP